MNLEEEREALQRLGQTIARQNGKSQMTAEEIAKQVLLEKGIEILVGLGSGDCAATAWGCDLTYDYVKINGDYRT